MSHLLWIDTETTGLGEDCQLVEVGAFVTTTDDLTMVDGPLDTLIDLGHDYPASYDEAVARPCWEADAWAMHEASGLADTYRDAGRLATHHDVAARRSVADVEAELLGMAAAVAAPGQLVMAGSGVHFDRRVLNRLMPALCSYLHYRLLDVTTMRMAAEAWRPEAAYRPPKRHRALDDAAEAWREARHYRDGLFAVTS